MIIFGKFLFQKVSKYKRKALFQKEQNPKIKENKQLDLPNLKEMSGSSLPKLEMPKLKDMGAVCDLPKLEFPKF